MNKKEWKLQHAANRRMYQGLFAPMRDGEMNLTDNDNFNASAKMYWGLLDGMHWSFKYAMQRNNGVSYPLSENRWAAHHNSTCFNENKRYD